jgi:hypothetical protein
MKSRQGKRSTSNLRLNLAQEASAIVRQSGQSLERLDREVRAHRPHELRSLNG